MHHREATHEKTRYWRGEWCIIVYNGNIGREEIEADDSHKKQRAQNTRWWMERKDKHKQSNTEQQERCLDEDREEGDELMQLPTLELLQSPFAFLRTEMCYSVLPPSTVKLLQPSFHKHREKCIDQNEREAEEEEHVHRINVGRDLKGGGLKCRGCRVAELL